MNPFQLCILVYYKTKEFYKDLLNIIRKDTRYLYYRATEKEAYIKLGEDMTIFIAPFNCSNCCGQRGDFIFIEKEAADNVTYEVLTNTLEPLQWSHVGNIYVVKNASEVSFHPYNINTLNDYIKERIIKSK